MTPLLMTMGELLERIEQLFDCRDGPYQCYVSHDEQRLDYVTLACIGKSDKSHTSRDIIHALRGHLFGRFFDLAAPFVGKEKPILYWRFAPEERIQEEARTLRKYTKHLIRTRVAIVGADYSLIRMHVEGADYPTLEEARAA